MKKWISMMFVLAVCLSFTACGDDKKDANTEGGDKKGGDQKTVNQKPSNAPPAIPEVDENAGPPKSRLFSSAGEAFGRAFLKKGEDDNSSSSPVENEKGDQN